MTTPGGDAPRHTNRLIHEASPYLLQHAHNPVDWFPWGEEALRKARDENKPIFLSIGYSACHWCHVMEHECFENESIAALMNENFINVKVDREERPDLDDIYMNAVQAMTGQGGWPMSVFLTPDLRPFYGGTYFPPQDMYGRPGFPTVLTSLARTYNQERERVDQAAQELTERLNEMMRIEPSNGALTFDLIDNAYRSMRERFDEVYGGFGSAPKFPHSMDIALLLRYHKRTGDSHALRMAEFSLRKMAEGGLYDQVGGGFHRYSVDEKWLVPHFEKMLYDNALLAKTYTEAYQLTANPFYRKIVKETLDYVLREMTSPAGGFYSTQDADSEGEEGKFFVWTPEQIREALGDDEQTAKIARRHYGVEPGGNFEHGTTVLHVHTDLETVAKLFEISEDEAREAILKANCKLFAAREKRVKPGRDEKILTDWNGLMISAMAVAGAAFNEEKYRIAAEKACDFIFANLWSEKRLLHAYKDGRAYANGYLSDYSYMIAALLDVYEAGRDPKRLQQALELAGVMIERFGDEEHGGFFFTGNDHEELIARSKDPMDNAVPSGNSMATIALLRLSEMTGDATYRAQAQDALRLFAERMKQIPMGFPLMLCGLEFFLGEPVEIALCGPDDVSLDAFHRALSEGFLPNKSVLFITPERESALRAIAPIAKGKTPIDGKAAAYVCRNFTCEAPTLSVDAMLEALEIR